MKLVQISYRRNASFVQPIVKALILRTKLIKLRRSNNDNSQFPGGCFDLAQESSGIRQKKDGSVLSEHAQLQLNGNKSLS